MDHLEDRMMEVRASPAKKQVIIVVYFDQIEMSTVVVLKTVFIVYV